MKIEDFEKKHNIKKKYKHKQVTIDKIIDFLKKNCSEFLYNNLMDPLFRGVNTNYDTGVVIIDPTTGIRRSANTYNHYTLIMDNSPYYEGWPKRSKSLICTTNSDVAKNYGNVMAVIPVNGSKIGIVPSTDIWDIKVKFYRMPKYSNMNLGDVPELLYDLGFPDTSFEQMMKYSTTNKFKKFIKFYISSIPPEDFMPYLLKKMSPRELGLEFKTTLNFKTNNYPDNECWVEGKCVLIRKDLYFEKIANMFDI
jgi:hypothetical protein